MSTTSHGFDLICPADRCHALQHFILGLGNISCLLQPERLACRLTLLDELDFMIGGLDLEELAQFSDPQVMVRAKALRSEFEAANEKVYAAARTAIAAQKNVLAIQRLLLESSSDGEREPRPGLAFDILDEIVNGILQLREPCGVSLPQSPEMVLYQPTPARHILDLIAVSGLSSGDILVDLGSGLGHVPLLASILTGCRALGIEFQPAYVASAQESALTLNAIRVQFVAEDAREADISIGTVFYMFSPFNGSILTDVLNRLFKESKNRQIRLCSLGPATRVLRRQSWLRSDNPPVDDRIALFKSC